MSAIFRSLSALCLTTLITVACGDSNGGGPVEAKVCVDHCTADADCRIMGTEGVCRDTVCYLKEQAPCTGDFECFVAANDRSTCADSADCGPTVPCIDLGDGIGRCIRPPIEQIPCSVETEIAAQYPEVGTGELWTVCVRNFGCSSVSGRCEQQCSDDFSCQIQEEYGVLSHCLPTRRCGCMFDEECFGVGLTACIAGQCGCKADEDCADSPDGRACRNGRCGCASDDNCFGRSRSVCYDGVCGCEDDSVCNNQFEGAVAACDPL